MVRNKLNIFAMLNSCPNFIAGRFKYFKFSFAV